MNKIQCIAKLNEILLHSANARYEYEAVTKDWVKVGINRTYFSITEKSKNYSASKHSKVREYGYYDNVNDVYVPGRADLNDNYTFGGNSY